MGHVVNPTAFRLGRVLFWRFNFIHFRQKFLFNRYFLLSVQCYKLIAWMFQSPLTISYFFNRFLRFLMKKTVLRKFIIFNFIMSKSISFFLYESSNNFLTHRLIFLFKSFSALHTIILNNFGRKKSLVQNSKCKSAFVSGLSNLFKARRLGLLNLLKSEYKSLKRRNKKYIWILKKSLLRFLVKFKFFKGLKSRNYFYNVLMRSVLQIVFKTSGVRKYNLKLLALYFFFRQDRLKKKYIFRTKFKNLMVNLEVDNVVINLQNNLLQLNMIIFKEFWLDNFKILLVKTFYEGSRITTSWQRFVLHSLYSYFTIILDFLKKTLLCYFLDVLNPINIKKKLSYSISSIKSLRIYVINNMQRYFYFFSLKKRKYNLKSLYNLFFF